jgi:hypothetical protein
LLAAQTVQHPIHHEEHLSRRPADIKKTQQQRWHKFLTTE